MKIVYVISGWRIKLINEPTAHCEEISFEIDENNNVLHTIRRHDFKKVKLFDSPAHGACTLFRKNTLINMGGYDENFSCQDGFEIWLRL